MKKCLPKSRCRLIYPLILSSALALSASAAVPAQSGSSASNPVQGKLLSLTKADSPILSALRHSYRITPQPIALGNQDAQARQRSLQALLSDIDAVVIDMARLDDDALREHRAILEAAQRARVPVVIENVSARLMAKMIGLGYTAPAVVIAGTQGGEHYDLTLTMAPFNLPGASFSMNTRRKTRTL